jgi:hypothetical protein
MAGERIASLFAEIGAKVDGYMNGSKAVKNDLGGLGNAFKRVLPSSILQFASLGGAIAGAGAILKGVTDKAAEAEAVQARLNAALIATGRGAEISAAQIDTTARSLEHLSAFDDESIKSAYTSLMQFSNVPTGKFESITKTAMDVTAALGGDLAGNAESIGRILETGLIPRSFGFTAALKAQVKAEIDAGDKGKALTLVLDELNKRYGGQAAAQLDTYSGKIKKLGNDWDDALEAIGQAPLGSGKGIIDTVDGIVLSYGQWVAAGNKVREGNLSAWDKTPLIGYFTQISKIKNMKELMRQSDIGYRGRGAPAPVMPDMPTEPVDNFGNSLDSLEVKNNDLLSSMQNFSDIAENYRDRTNELISQAGELEAQKKNLIAQGYAPEGEAITEINKRLQENKTAQEQAGAAAEESIKKQIVAMIEAKMMSDGKLTDGEFAALLKIKEQWGLMSQAAVEGTRLTDDAVKQYMQTGDLDAFGLAIDDISHKILNLPTTKTIDIVLNVTQTGDTAGLTPDNWYYILNNLQIPN